MNQLRKCAEVNRAKGIWGFLSMSSPIDRSSVLNGSRRPAAIGFWIVAPYCFEVMLLSRGVIVSVECNDESVRERAVVD